MPRFLTRCHLTPIRNRESGLYCDKRIGAPIDGARQLPQHKFGASTASPRKAAASWAAASMGYRSLFRGRTFRKMLRPRAPSNLFCSYNG